MGTLFKKHDNWYIDYYANGSRVRKKIGKSKLLADSTTHPFPRIHWLTRFFVSPL